MNTIIYLFISGEEFNTFTQTEASMTNISQTPLCGGLLQRPSSHEEPYGVTDRLLLKRATFELCYERDAQLKAQLHLNWFSFLSPSVVEDYHNYFGLSSLIPSKPDGAGRRTSDDGRWTIDEESMTEHSWFQTDICAHL